MGVSVIIDRIRASVVANELKQVPETARFSPIGRISDLLTPWDVAFPGAIRHSDDEIRDIFSRNGQRKPRFSPQVRRSFRPLPPPWPISASPSTVNPGLFDSVRGIWEFYQARGLADHTFLQQNFDEQGLAAFIQPLCDAVADWYPLYIPLEMLSEEGHPRDLDNIHLLLPHYDYDDNGAGVVESFLTGIEAIAGMMEHYLDDTDLELPDKDRRLIGELGFMELVKTYEIYNGAKTVDLEKLLKTGPDLFFDPLAERFPAQMSTPWPIISGDSGYDCDVPITCSQDIEFCLAYADTYDRLIGLIPCAYDFDQNDGGVTEEFMHELCEVWRKYNGKRPVTWTSPKRARLSHIFKQERIPA